MNDNLVNVILMNDDRSLTLTISFFGFSQEAIENYLTKTFIESKKEHAKKWTQMKYV